MKKKGFTLIELLAVIVILAIIALIATPLVLNTIDKAKKGAAKASALEYMNAVERYMVEAMLDTTMPQLQPGVEYQLSNKKYEVAAVADPNTVYINDLIEMKGDKPEKGYLIVNKQGTVEKMEMVMNKYPVECSNSKCEVTGDKEEEQENNKGKTYNTGDMVQLTVGSDTSTQWYVLAVNNDNNTVKLLSKEYLLNNTAKHHAYQSDAAFEAAGDDKSSLTYNTSRIKPLVDNYGATLNLGSNLKSIGLISIEDLQKIGCNVDVNTCSNLDSWIYDTGWTSTISDPSTGSAWQIQADGTIISESPIADGFDHSPFVRPVIVVSKDVIKAVEYQAYNVADAVTIDGVGYHVIKSSSSKDEHVTLLRDESIGEFAFDENGGTDYETSTLITYLNSTYKDTFGDKKQYIREITILPYGGDNGYVFQTISELEKAPEGTALYLYHRYHDVFFPTSSQDEYGFSVNLCESGNLNEGCKIDYTNSRTLTYEETVLHDIDVVSFNGVTYFEKQWKEDNSYMYGAALTSTAETSVRPVITISKDAIN